MYTNFAKLAALMVVAAVAKALFQTPDPTFNYYYNGETINPNADKTEVEA